MKNEVFNKLAKQETDRMLDVMCSKSSDYAKDDDKLFNFKQAGRIDGVTPIEALRGMWLKHRASIQQGLDELLAGKKPRPREWWIEKLTDDRNYNLLLFAQLEEEYFLKDGTSPGYGKQGRHIDVVPIAKVGIAKSYIHFCICSDFSFPDADTWASVICSECHGVKPVEDNKPEEFMEFTIKKCGLDNKRGFYIIKTDTMQVDVAKFLHKNLELHGGTWYVSGEHGYGEAPGYYKTKDEARATIMAYKNMPVFPVFKVKKFTEVPRFNRTCDWWVHYLTKDESLALHSDLILRKGSEPCSTAYYPTKEIAEAYVKAYEEKQRCGQG